jgi:hypothetical protein
MNTHGTSIIAAHSDTLPVLGTATRYTQARCTARITGGYSTPSLRSAPSKLGVLRRLAVWTHRLLPGCTHHPAPTTPPAAAVPRPECQYERIAYVRGKVVGMLSVSHGMIGCMRDTLNGMRRKGAGRCRPVAAGKQFVERKRNEISVLNTMAYRFYVRSSCQVGSDARWDGEIWGT